jgi:hypothetical protein
MARLANPNQNRPFEEISRDAQGNEEYGKRGEEIVHIPSGRSNMAYHQLETVMDPTGCEHRFFVTNIGSREIECERCHWATTFHPGINHHEVDGRHTVTIQGQSYEILT